MWHLKLKSIPIDVGALGTKKAQNDTKISKIMLINAEHILRKALSI